MFQLVRLLASAVAVATVLGAAPQAVGGTADGMTLARPAYPATRRGTVVDFAFGERVADPYRWLENDVRSDSEVADWVLRQDAVTRAYLDRLPAREDFTARIRRLLDYERFGIPRKAGGRYFFTRNSGLQNQPELFYREGLDGPSRRLLDPNGWSVDGTTALDQWEPSRKGATVAFSVQDGGSDWRTVRFVDVASGRTLADELRWA